jgi:hypothetical protein
VENIKKRRVFLREEISESKKRKMEQMFAFRDFV